MNEKPPDNAGHRSWAHFRFAVVGPLLAAPPENLGEEIEKLAGRIWQHPTRATEQRKFGFSTIERWYYEARRSADPVGRLTRRIRKDSGRRRPCPPRSRRSSGGSTALTPAGRTGCT